MESNPKITIIVPVYKVEPYIKKCIESIIGQTYTNWELLLVDDGSPDNSGDICDEYARKDTRIRVFHQVNSGVSTARNLALDNAEGKWVMFVDSDDWLELDCIARCVVIAETNALDLLQFTFKRVDDNGNILVKKAEESTGIQRREDYVNSAGRLSVCVGGNLLRNNIIQNHNIQFDKNIKFGEDQLFIFNYVHYCKKCMKVSVPLYNYRYNSTSATSLKTQHPEAHVKTLKAFETFKWRKEFEWYVQSSIFDSLNTIIRSNKVSICKIHKLLKNEKLNLLKPNRKFEHLFFPLYKRNKYLGLLYLRAASLLIKYLHDTW